MNKADLVTTRDERKLKTYAALNTEQKRADDFFEMVATVELPRIDGIVLKRTKAMREKVMAGVQVFMSRIPRAEVDPRKPTDKARQQASKLETFYNYILWQHRPLGRSAYQKCLLRGMGVGKLWYDDHYQGVDKNGWKQADHDNLAYSALERFPIRLSSPDPLNCYPSLAMQTFFQPVDMIEDYMMSVSEALYVCKMNQWKTTWKKGLADDAESVRYTTYYSNDERIVLFDDKMVVDGENPLGFVPYVVIPSGLGQDSYEGKPEYKYRDIIYQDIEAEEVKMMLMSYLHYGFRKNALPQKWFQADNAEEAKTQLEGISDAPDQIGILPRTIDKIENPTEPINAGAFTFLSLLQSTTGVPATLLGLPAQNTYSEVHYSTQAAYARAQYEIALDNLEMGFAELLGMCSRTVEWLDNPISIRNVNPGERSKNIETISPEDVAGYYQCRVKFIGDTPEGRQTREQQGLMLLRQKAMPYVDVMVNYFDVPRPEAERMELDLQFELVKALPQFTLSAALEIADQRGNQRGFELVAIEMAKAGLPIPEWAQMKLSQQNVVPTDQNLQMPRGGDHRQPETLPTGAESVPLHAQQNVQGMNPREVVAREQ